MCEEETSDTKYNEGTYVTLLQELAERERERVVVISALQWWVW
jgi:hypothetical protein